MQGFPWWGRDLGDLELRGASIKIKKLLGLLKIEFFSQQIEKFNVAFIEECRVSLVGEELGGFPMNSMPPS